MIPCAEALVKRPFPTVSVFVAPLAVLCLSCGSPEPEPTAPDVPRVVTSHRDVDVRWERDWDAAFSRARAEGKPVLVSFSAEWCVWCKHLDTITYRDARVAGVLAERVIPLTIDIDRADRELLAQLEHFYRTAPIALRRT